MSNLNFVFAGNTVVLTEDIKKRSYVFDGARATTKQTLFKIEEKKGITYISSVEAITDAGHRWVDYPECFCKIVTKEEVTREEIKKLILASSYIGSELRYFRSKEKMYLDACNTPPVTINKKGEVETYNGTIIKY